MPSKTFKAFVSSTFEDLKDHRAYVISALRKAGIFVDPMEDWTAESDEPKQFSKERLAGCDFCVLLVALRRGYIPKGENRSITQLEYQAALDERIDVLVYLLDENSPWPHRFVEIDKDPYLLEWRRSLEEKHGRGLFGLDPSSIEIAPAITRWVEKQSQALTTEADFEKRRIDAVAPSNATLEQSMDVFIQVRFPDSEYLSIKDWPFKNKPSSIEQASKLTNVRYSRNNQGQLHPAYLRIKIVAPEFRVEGKAEKKIEIVPKQLSDLISFQLTPKALGEQRIIVQIYDENSVSVGELPVETKVNDKQKPIVNEANIVVLNLNVLVLVEAFNPHERQIEFLRQNRQVIYRPKIVGGDAVKDRNAYPWMTALVAHGLSPDRGQFCGGALIAPNWVLTAAHCPYGNDPDDFDVVLGIIDLRRETPEERIAVAEIIIHPQYDPDTFDCDLALLRLSKASQKQPVLIISSGDPEGLTDPERPVIAIRWGATFEGGPGTKILSHVEVPVVSYNQAKEGYGRHGVVVTENMLSAGYPEGGKDACQGDSGGPLIAVQKGQKILVGVTIWGIGCARPGLPGLYARLSVLGDWVTETISRG